MRDFVEIQYSVLWKLCFYQNYFWLVETIFGIRRKQFSKKEFIFYIVETVYLVSAISLLDTITGIRRKQFWEKELILASVQLIFRLVKTIFCLRFSETPASFFPVYWKSIFQGNSYFRLVKTDFRANNGFHKHKKICK